jgi:hypothetical protein
MAEYLNREQSAADRANHSVNGIPRGVDPRNFVGEKFEEVEDTGDRDDCRVAQDLEQLIGRRERDPVEMDGQSGDENREIKVDAGQASQAERDRKEVKLLHEESICAGESLSRRSSRPDQMTRLE